MRRLERRRKKKSLTQKLFFFDVGKWCGTGKEDE